MALIDLLRSYGPLGIAAGSLVYNIVQFVTARREKAALRALVQGDYNVYYHIARQCGRMRKDGLDDDTRRDEAIRSVEVIRGCADSARSSLVAFSREHLRFVPFYEHPAEPGKEQSAEVRFGAPLGEGPSISGNVVKKEGTSKGT